MVVKLTVLEDDNPFQYDIKATLDPDEKYGTQFVYFQQMQLNKQELQDLYNQIKDVLNDGNQV